MAGELIRVAAQRMTHAAPRLTVPEGLYDEFCARFPYEETADQQSAIQTTLDDLAAGRPMDRLVCGDVGFGKTEVALRAAFAAAINGKQTAIIAPTTLLSRQHTQNFRDRFAGLPVGVGQLSRMVGAAESREVKKGLAEGSIDIVVGTHAVLGKTVSFKDLGLVVIDEEQHFGVGHKERLKELRSEVHVLTLSATPIPRTLQLAMTGRARDVDHRDAADRPARGAHLRLAVRRAYRPRGASARALSRRPVVLCLPAHRGPRRSGGVPAPERARVQIRRRPRPDGGARARGQGRRLLRRQVRHSLVDGDRRIRPRHSARQYDDRASRRHVRPRAALSIARPRRPLEGARLCVFHHAGQGQDHAAGREAALGAAIARCARRGLSAREPRPRSARRRQPSGRGAVRPHQGGRLRALSADGARGGRAHQVGRGRAGRGHVVADDPARRAGDDPRSRTSRTYRRGSLSIAASRRWRTRARSTRWPPRSSTASARRRPKSAS